MTPAAPEVAGVVVSGPRPSRLAAALALLAGPLAAEPPRLSLPVDCRPGETCYVQALPDRDPGLGGRDHACGGLTYDRHSGTDVALPDLAAMRAGVAVLAAAPGVVMAARDGMPDGGLATPDLAARRCGNGVSIDHGGGWHTQYCHLRRGSVAVRPGARVGRGARLGLVGLSGQTELPHLHMTLRRGREVVDPFDASGGPCGGPRDSLWLDEPAHRPTGLIAAGTAAGAPSLAAIREGGLAHPGRRDAALVVWAHGFGGRAGDRVVLRLAGPAGRVIDQVRTLGGPAAYLHASAGRHPPRGGWAPGLYRGEARLERGGRVIDRADLRIRVR